MKRFFRLFVAAVCVSILFPLAAEAQFGHTTNVGRTFGGANVGTTNLDSGLKFGVDVDNLAMRGYYDADGYSGDESTEYYYAWEVLANVGYQFNPHLYCGLSIGGGSTPSDMDDPRFIAAVALRSYLSQGKTAPMVSLNVGYMNYFGDDSTVYASPGVGVRFGLGERSGISVQFVAVMDMLYYKDDGGLGFGLRLGYDF